MDVSKVNTTSKFLSYLTYIYVQTLHIINFKYEKNPIYLLLVLAYKHILTDLFDEVSTSSSPVYSHQNIDRRYSKKIQIEFLCRTSMRE